SLTLPSSTSPLFPYTTLFRSLRAEYRRLAVIRTNRNCFVFDLSLIVWFLLCVFLVLEKRRKGMFRCNRFTFAAVSAAVSQQQQADRKSTRLNSSHVAISYAVF